MNSHTFYEERHKKRLRSWQHIKYLLKKPLIKIGLIKPKTSQNWVTPKYMYSSSLL